jgi:hypothetical protein
MEGRRGFKAIKYAGKLYHLIREIFWDCMFV